VSDICHFVLGAQQLESLRIYRTLWQVSGLVSVAEIGKKSINLSGVRTWVHWKFNINYASFCFEKNSLIFEVIFADVVRNVEGKIFGPSYVNCLRRRCLSLIPHGIRTPGSYAMRKHTFVRVALEFESEARDSSCRVEYEKLYHGKLATHIRG
jgi:hypothetical protein